LTNILLDPLPEAITVSGKKYKINSDFKPVIKSLIAYEDNDLTGLEKQSKLLQNLLPVMPNDIQTAAEQINLFLAGKGGAPEENDEGQAPNGLRLYSFDQDAKYIYSAFLQTHKIDLQKVDLHWWVFLSLFMDLGQETFFCQLIALRKRLATPGKASKEDRQIKAEMSHVVNLDGVDDRTLDEKEVAKHFDDLVAQGLKKKTK
jgi:hypothetical protein